MRKFKLKNIIWILLLTAFVFFSFMLFPENYKKYTEVKEQLAVDETKKKLKKMEIDLINEKNQRKIESLEKENEIRRLRLEAQKLQRYIFIAVIIIFLVVFIHFSRKYLSLFAFWKKKNYISRYRIIDQIGSGGMANIFKVVYETGSKKKYLP